MSDSSYIHLLGSAQESYYSLGKKDALAAKQIFQSIDKRLFSFSILKPATELASELYCSLANPFGDQYQRQLKSYAEGLECPYEQAVAPMLLIEATAMMGRFEFLAEEFIPHAIYSILPAEVPSTLAIHAGAFGQELAPFLRPIRREFASESTFYSLSTPLFPLIGQHSVNQYGLTLALLPEKTSHFHAGGQAIYILLDQIMHQAQNLSEAKKIIRSFKPMRNWKLIISSPEKEVLAVKIGENKCQIKEQDILNKEALIYSSLKGDQSSLNNIIGQYSKKKKNQFLETSKNLINSKEFPLSSYALSFCTKDEISYIKGPYEKLMSPEIISHNKIFSLQEITTSNIEITQDSDQKALVQLVKAQKYFDTKEDTHALHHLQLAMIYAQDLQLKTKIHFFLLAWQYLLEEEKDDLKNIYKEFISIVTTLPPHLQDHVLLFLGRIETILGHRPQDRKSDFNDKKLAKLYTWERNQPAILYNAYKKLTFIRIDIEEIFYFYHS